MKLLALVLTCIVLALLQATPVRAEANSGTWDIAEFDSCFGLGPDDLDRLLGPNWTQADFVEHYRYCCYKSGGVLSGEKCVAPASSAASSSALPPSIGVLGEQVSSGRLEKVCLAVKGLFDQAPSSGSYLCTKKNCDLRDGDCKIACAGNQRCVAITPTSITSPLTLFGLLQNGDNVNRDRDEPSSADSESESSEEPPPVILY